MLSIIMKQKRKVFRNLRCYDKGRDYIAKKTSYCDIKQESDSWTIESRLLVLIALFKNVAIIAVFTIFSMIISPQS